MVLFFGSDLHLQKIWIHDLLGGRLLLITKFLGTLSTHLNKLGLKTIKLGAKQKPGELSKWTLEGNKTKITTRNSHFIDQNQ